ncbi:MAG: 4-hydroxythreonine-4-phosphate dehydrogenase PdxA, partial [Candidatus Accumulibacter sp.]|nr:4-hydroxythreonine-4-phosphate dehydrogenase PdxA [Accumulibacter sp.]
MSAAPVIAVTSGEPAGVGPELCLRLAGYSRPPARLVVLGDKGLLAARACLLGVDVSLRDWRPAARPEPGTLEVLDLPADAGSVPGRLDPSNSRYVLRLLDRALAGCVSGEFAAMVT